MVLWVKGAECDLYLGSHMRVYTVCQWNTEIYGYIIELRRREFNGVIVK